MGTRNDGQPRSIPFRFLFLHSASSFCCGISLIRGASEGTIELMTESGPPSLLGPMSLRPATPGERECVLAAIEIGEEAKCPRCGEPVRVAPLSAAGPGFKRYECTHDACEFCFEQAT